MTTHLAPFHPIPASRWRNRGTRQLVEVTAVSSEPRVYYRHLIPSESGTDAYTYGASGSLKHGTFWEEYERP